MAAKSLNERGFGAVFHQERRGGPKKIEWEDPHTVDFISSGLKWEDRRRPGNTDANESAASIMKGWSEERMKRFDVFMSQIHSELTPWKQTYLEKTAPKWRDQSKNIIKCRMELIKRLLIIKITGPASLEDWILLFLYYENELNIPKNIEELLSAPTMLPEQYLQLPHPVEEYAPYSLFPPANLIESDNYANPPMPGFGSYSGRKDAPVYQIAGAVSTRSNAFKSLRDRHRSFPFGNSGPQQTTLSYISRITTEGYNRPR